MSDEIEQLAARLVIGHRRDGRSVYDEQAKAELVQASRQPGVSLSRLARECGVNANQLSRWEREHERKKAQMQQSSFVPVAIAAVQAPPSEVALALEARLPNGVILNLRCDLEQADRFVQTLGSLRCSASIPS